MTGTVTLSIEVELGWGMHDLDRYAHLSPDGAVERRYLRRLLAACDAAGVRVSFDVVGHLFLESCRGTHEGPYPAGWFDADPGTDADADPLFYAPDVVDAIRASETDHEICTHTFSHALCDQLDAAAVDRDLALAQRQHERVCGERTRSIVPPRHGPPPQALLDRHGLDVVRFVKQSEPATRAHRYFELLGGAPPPFEPTVTDGVVETYGTGYMSLTAPALPSGQASAHPAFRPLPRRLRQRLHERALDRAVRRTAATDGYLHLWCHLWDLSNAAQWRSLGRFVDALGDRADAGDVEIARMCDLPGRVGVTERSRADGASAAADTATGGARGDLVHGDGAESDIA